MKKLLLILSLLLLPTWMCADTINYNLNGVLYNLYTDSRSAKLTGLYNKNFPKTVNIPQVIDYKGVEYTVTSIGNNAFYECSALTDVTIPETVKAIHSHAFSHCDSLTALNLPDTLETIDNGAFEFCSKLSEVNIPDSVISFGKSVFHGCTGLKKVIVSENQPILKTKDGILFSKDELTLI